MRSLCGIGAQTVAALAVLATSGLCLSDESTPLYGLWEKAVTNANAYGNRFDHNEIELRARHILVKTEEEARDVVEKVNRGGDFAELAKETSTGPSKDFSRRLFDY